MSASQISYYLDYLPLVEFRRHLPLAQLEAALRNIVGGKPSPDEAGKAVPPERLYSAYELLPGYARFEAAGAGIPVEAAQDFLAHTEQLPGWVLQIAPIEAIRQAVG